MRPPRPCRGRRRRPPAPAAAGGRSPRRVGRPGAGRATALNIGCLRHVRRLHRATAPRPRAPCTTGARSTRGTPAAAAPAATPTRNGPRTRARSCRAAEAALERPRRLGELPRSALRQLRPERSSAPPGTGPAVPPVPQQRMRVSPVQGAPRLRRLLAGPRTLPTAPA